MRYGMLTARSAAIQSDPLQTRGCPAGCDDSFETLTKSDILVQDDRGRWWHLDCVSVALARITRKDEDRPDAHYEWGWEDS